MKGISLKGLVILSLCQLRTLNSKASIELRAFKTSSDLVACKELLCATFVPELLLGTESECVQLLYSKSSWR